MPKPVYPYLTAGEVLNRLYARGVSDSEVARLTGVNQSTITRIRQDSIKNPASDLYFRILAAARATRPEVLHA